jgi:hypothetical protein
MRQKAEIDRFFSMPPITCLMGNHRSLWIGTTKGLWRLDTKKLKMTRLSSDFVTDMQLIPGSNTLLMTTWMGRGLVMVHDTGRVTVVGNPTKQPYDRSLTRLNNLYSSEGSTFVATDAGLYVYRQNDWREVLADLVFLRVRGSGQDVWAVADDAGKPLIFQFHVLHSIKRLPLPMEVDSNLMVDSGKIWFSGQDKGSVFVCCYDKVSDRLKSFSTGIRLSPRGKEAVGCTSLHMQNQAFLLGIGTLSMTSDLSLSGDTGGLYLYQLNKQADLLSTDKRLRNVKAVWSAPSKYWVGTDKGLASVHLE